MTDFNKDSGRVSILYGIAVSFVFFWYNLHASLPVILLGIILMLLPILFIDGKNVFLIYVFLSPFVGMIKFQGNPNAILSYCLFIFNIVFLLSRKCKEVRLALLIHFFCVFFSVVINNDVSLFLKMIRAIVFFDFIVCFYSETRNDTLFLWKLIRAYIVGVMVNCLHAVLFAFLKGQNILNITLSGIRQDRNGFAGLCCFAICFALLDLIYNKNIKQYFAIFMLSVIGILTKSRTFIVVLAFSIVMFVVNSFLSNKKGAALKFIFVLIMITFIFRDKIQLILQPVMDRFSDPDVTTGNGRTTVWGLYLSKVFSSPISALVGCGSATRYLGTLATQVEHNTYIETIFNIGILGCVTLICVLYDLFKQVVFCYEIKKIDLVSLLPIVVLLMVFSSLSLLYSLDINIPITLSFIVVSLSSRKDQNEEMYCDM